MELFSGLGGLLIIVGVVVFVLLAIAFVFARNYIKVPKNKVAVFTGRGEAKIVNGGARFRMPLLEQVNVMSIEPFNIDAKVVDVYSKDNVPVSVTAVGQVKFSSSREAFALSTERYLDTPREALKPQLTEIVSGTMRNIVSQLTIEELNGNREEFMRRVKDEAAQSFQPIGMQLDVFTIQNISDNNGYLDALGQRRIAEVKRDAVIGKANAERGLQTGTAIANGMALTKRLGNLPPNICTPAFLGDEAKKLARQWKLGCEVLETKQIEALKMKSFLNVAKASSAPSSSSPARVGSM